MADVHSKEIRSNPDSYREAAKSKNTKPEMLVRKFLHANGFRYKLHDKSLPNSAKALKALKKKAGKLLIGVGIYDV